MSLKQIARRSALFVLTASFLTMVACSGLESSHTGSPRSGTITADPNPIRVCDGTGLGVTKLSWTSVSTNRVEVRVNFPDGALLAQTARTGTSETGKWVTDGMTFHLQDVSGGEPLTAENTLATATLKVTTAGCP